MREYYNGPQGFNTLQTTSGVSYYTKETVMSLLNYLGNRWPSTKEWCAQHNRMNAAGTIFYKNLFEDKKRVLDNVLKYIDMTPVELAEIPENERQSIADKYMELVNNKITEKREEKDSAARIARENFNKWLEDNKDWVDKIDGLNTRQATEKLREIGDIPNRTPQYNDIINALNARLTKIEMSTKVYDFGIENNWNYEYSKNFIIILGMFRSKYNYRYNEKRAGMHYDKFTYEFFDQHGEAVAKIVYSLDTTD